MTIMHCAHLVVDRSKLDAEHPCHRFLPIDVEKEDISVDIQVCCMSAEGSGQSIIKISDLSDAIPQGKFVYDGGWSNISRIGPGQYSAVVNNDKCMLASIINNSGCFLTSAIPVTDTYIKWTLIASDASRLQYLFRLLRERGYVFSVESMREVTPEPVLTPKQQLCFDKALEMGYYDIPKSTDLESIADALGISKSTLNVTLRTAERNIFRFYSDNYVPPGKSGSNSRSEHIRNIF